MLVKLNNFLRYEIFIFIGLTMALGTLIKLLGFYDFSSDWFWFIASIGLMIEGAIELARQQKFEKKYKIIEIDEEKKVEK